MLITIDDQLGGTMTPSSRLGAELLIDALVASGIDTIFGLPGDTGVTLYDALYHRQDAIRHVLTRDERHAVQMADAYARTTNRIGVAEVSSGGGTTYAVGGLGEAFAASVPVMLIATDIHRASRGTGALTELDLAKLFQAVTKRVLIADSAAGLPALVAAAIEALTTGRPAPVALVIPEDILDEEVAGTGALGPGPSRVPRDRPIPDQAALSEAAARLGAARRPLIVAGSGVHVSTAYDELRSLASILGSPVATTIQGKGAIGEDDEWFLGTVGNNSGRDYANQYAAEADVVLLVGTRANSTDTNGFRSPPRPGPYVIQIDIDAGRAGRNYPSSLALVGDAREALRAIGEMVSVRHPAWRPSSSWLEQARLQWQVERASGALPAGALDPRDVIETVQAVLGDSAIVVADPGTPTPNVTSYWRLREPGRRVLIPRGHGPMGYAIPGAVGAAFAAPGTMVVAVTADGSFAMSCGELETISRYQLPILIVQYTNGSFGWIKMLQHLYMGGRYFGVDPGRIDSPAVARACGLLGIHASQLDDVRDAVEQFRQLRSPSFIEVDVPSFSELVPPVPAWHEALAGATSRPIY